MQHCTVCGSEIPDDARFCNKCGHTLDQVSTIDEETTNTDTSSVKGEPLDDVTELSTQELAHFEEAANGHQSEDVTAVSTQELVHAKEEEHVQKPENQQQPEDVTEISTQELAHPENGEREEGGVSEEPAVMEVIQAVPDQDYASIADVMKAVGEVESGPDRG